MRSKKSYTGWNMVWPYVVGLLILYGVFRRFRKNKSEKKLEDFPTQPANLVQKQTELTQQEIFDWFVAREGLRYSKYPDAGGFAIGIGHFIKPDEQYLLNKTLTQQEVLDLFNKDFKEVLNTVNTQVKVPLNKNQKLAMLSYAWNVGPTAFKNSQLVKRLNEGNYTGAAVLFPTSIVTSQGVFNQGLVNRRKLEQQLFSKPV
jgi:GH24 family phage-related lysozyme (muramidase)